MPFIFYFFGAVFGQFALFVYFVLPPIILGLGEQWDREGVRGAEAAWPPRQLFPGHRGRGQGHSLQHRHRYLPYLRSGFRILYKTIFVPFLKLVL